VADGIGTGFFYLKMEKLLRRILFLVLIIFGLNTLASFFLVVCHFLVV